MCVEQMMMIVIIIIIVAQIIVYSCTLAHIFTKRRH